MRKHIIKTVIIICLISITIFNFSDCFGKKAVPVQGAEIDLSAVKELEKADIDSVQKSINAVNQKYEAKRSAEKAERIRKEKSKNAAEGINSVKEQINSGERSLNKIFSSSLIVGDSLIEAISYYHVLDSQLVMGKVSASLYELDSISDKIIAYHPEVLILHYGENHISGPSEEKINRFTNLYIKLIDKFRKKIPDTRIVVSSIFLPSETGLKKSPYLKVIPLYNEALKKMCAEKGIEFLDNDPIFTGNDSFYGGDGVHMDKSFYTEHWLPYIAYVLDL